MAEKRILFVCTQNSARSQMAEGLFRALHGDEYEVFSAGTSPWRVNPFAIEAMQRIGIDIRAHRSKSIDELLDLSFDYIVTVCDHAKEQCPYVPGGKTRLHQSFSDPAAVKGTEEEILQAFESVRDEIMNWIKEATANGTIEIE